MEINKELYKEILEIQGVTYNEKSRWFNESLANINQALQLHKTNVMRSFYCDSKDCNDSKGALCNGFCKGLAEEPKNDA